MSYPISVQHIQGVPAIPFRNGVGQYEGVVCHSTANNNDTAQGEHNFEQNTFNNAFVHYFVDDVQIIETASPLYEAWHACKTGNSRFVGVELCQPSDQGKFQQAYEKYVWLLAKLLADKGLGVKDGVTLWSHKQISDTFKESDHQDPIAYLASHGVTWPQHVSNVTVQYNAIVAPAQPHIPQTYVVQPGENLSEIAKKFATTVDVLQHLNNISNPSLIKPGEILNITVPPVAPKPVTPVAPPPPPPATTPSDLPLKVGSKGADVAFVQRFLGITADGIFGNGTKQAVENYQKMKGLVQDGVVGVNTWNVMHGK